MLRVRPDLGLFEQVFGFSLAESKYEKESPLVSFLQLTSELLSDYTPVVLLVSGSTFMCFERRRIYVVFIHNRVNPDGRRQDVLARLVEARASFVIIA